MKTTRSIVSLVVSAALMLGAVAVADVPVASADSVLVQNRSSFLVSFALADAAGECPNGMRDHAWILLGPSGVRGLNIELDGLVLVAGYAQVRIDLVNAILPNSHFSEQLLWSVPVDGSSDGQCSQVVRNPDHSEQPISSTAMWIAQWTKGVHCIPSVHGGDLNLGLLAFDGPPESPETVLFDFVCFGADGTPSERPPVDDADLMQ